MNSKSSLPFRKGLVSCLFLILFCFLTEASAYAGTVRGMLVRQNSAGRKYAAPYIGVSLNNKQIGRSSLVYSGVDGMYYLHNVPAGNYYLEVWVAPNHRLVYTINVTDEPYTDITPILIP